MNLKLCSYSLLFGQFLGLILVLYHADGLAPLLVTGNSSNIPKLFRRYLSTILHVKYWYEFNPFDPNSKSFKSLRQVRGMHKQVSRTMNQKSNRTEGTDNLWIPQYGMTKIVEFTKFFRRNNFNVKVK